MQTYLIGCGSAFIEAIRNEISAENFTFSTWGNISANWKNFLCHSMRILCWYDISHDNNNRHKHKVDEPNYGRCVKESARKYNIFLLNFLAIHGTWIKEWKQTNTTSSHL